MGIFVLEPFQQGDEQQPFWEYTVDLTDVTFTVRLRFATRLDTWYMDLLDADDNVIFAGKALRSSTAIAQRHRRVSSPVGMIFVRETDESGAEATFENLGELVVISYSDEEDLPTFIDSGRPPSIVGPV